ncbi:sulfatase-like hydrolase/transferase [Verrucomicrobiaceae bacterium N1E253]|uniref:Sulfatase-like hydrolase/transferase n=1 Tax=Oceaniferula marina TaxID=2748318 RepID=A0A851GDH4_9BACT|nr:sulfatase-like hydrolase/transferase [Oceaniferula marina]NWK55808.1 sulfatase-like hydrolase/transferase [Oceaniferula marina]
MIRTLSALILISLIPSLSAETITISGAANTSSTNDQGSASSGTLTCTTLVADNTSGTAPGQIQQFTISGLDLNNSGGSNDSVAINFRVTGSGNLQTNTSGTGWLSPGGTSLNGNGDEMTVTYESMSVNLDGGTGNGSGSFSGFSAITMGNWDNVNDTATINGEQFSYSGTTNETLPLTDTTQSSLSFSYTTADGDSGAWRPLGSHFTIEVNSAPPASPEPAITFFSSNRYQIGSNETITLSWSTTDATSLSIDQGLGDVTSLSTAGAGSIEVNANPGTTYTLTATNSEGSKTAALTVHPKPNKPNILVILTDDWGTEDGTVNFNLDKNGNPIAKGNPDSLGLPSFSQTNEHYHTPTLEQLASQGTIFTRAYVSPMCSPTRVSFMTGQNAARHRTTNYIGGGGSHFNLKSQPNLDLTAANRTLAEVMRDAGYRTIICGKGHIGNDNLDIDHYKTPAADPANDFYGFQINVCATQKGQHSNCYSNATPAFNLKGSSTSATTFMAEYQDKTYHDLDPVKYADATWKDEPVFVTEAITLEMIERLEDSVMLGKPFFAYMSHFATHQPHQLDPRFANNPKYAGLTGNTLDVATMIEGVDHSTHDILTRLDELGVAENTIVIFFGDNGSEVDPGAGGNPTTLGMSNPCRGQKGHRHEGGTRIPFIVSWAKPDASNPHQQAFPIAAGKAVPNIIASQDLFPTLCDAANISLPTQDDNSDPLVIDGYNLAGYLSNSSGFETREQLLIHSPTPHAHDFFSILHQGDWKLIYNYNNEVEDFNIEAPLGTYELYNLHDDPYEADNRASASSPNYNSGQVMQMARDLIAEITFREGQYPYLRENDAAMAAINLPASPGDDHPIILPAINGIDTDNDGLDDNAEDPNRNGIQDGSETDATKANSDDDNLDDGEEARLGTDPLDPGSYFKLQARPESDGSITLTWPSSPDTRFTIRTSNDLVDWSSIIASNISADPGSQTSYPLPASSSPRRFYKVELE